MSFYLPLPKRPPWKGRTALLKKPNRKRVEMEIEDIPKFPLRLVGSRDPQVATGVELDPAAAAAGWTFEGFADE